ncbi:Gfo/Idh/MocA family oxidoreductase [uncultured Tateyamaria sp.]|uniref:Gfo/Idh/MocA family protein n=1 Tax=Tateyamaria sp. 1078 TaxID=3417464 RepID=UPI002633B65D|nr:Gfo/Idh/MocA family oxidoreductase [uncultured Tateyamaria sp.]
MMRIGLAGAGLVGRRHLDAMARVRGMALSAVLDPVMADDDPLPRVQSLADLIAQSDGIILATPNHTHRPMAEEVLRAGLPVLVEKPLADTSDNARHIANTAAETGTPVLVGHHRRHNPLIAKAKEIVDSAALGAITTVHGNCWLPKPDSYYDQAWRQAAGAGPLFINLIHDVDVLMYLCGPIVAVQAFEANAQRQAAAEEVVAATVRFASGALGTLNLSDTALGPWSWELTAGENPAYPKTEQSSYLIGGTHGSLALPNLTVWSQENGPDWWAPISTTRYPVDSIDTLVAQLEHFSQVIAGRAQPRVSAQDGLRAVSVIEAIKQAAQTGQTVTLE